MPLVCITGRHSFEHGCDFVAFSSIIILGLFILCVSHHLKQPQSLPFAPLILLVYTRRSLRVSRVIPYPLSPTYCIFQSWSSPSGAVALYTIASTIRTVSESPSHTIVRSHNCESLQLLAQHQVSTEPFSSSTWFRSI